MAVVVARLSCSFNPVQDNPLEALIFGALISAVDPVATLSVYVDSRHHNPQCEQAVQQTRQRGSYLDISGVRRERSE